MVKRHKGDTKTFEELSYSDQARSINGQLSVIEDAIKANIEKAIIKKKENPKEKRIKNLEDLIERIKNYEPKNK